MSDPKLAITITVSDDGLTAVVSDVAHAGNAAPLFSKASLDRALEAAKVTEKPDSEAVQALAVAMESGKDVRGMVIVRGTPPTPAVNASIKPFGDLSRPIFPGEAFCEIIKARPAKDGMSVTGEPIKAPGEPQGKSITFSESPHCFIDTTTLQIRSETYGLAIFDKLTMHVKPLLTVTKGDMLVQATIYPTDFRGKELTAARMEDALKALEISALLDRKRFLKAMEQAKTSGTEVPNVTIARGLEPVNGKNGWFELYIKDERSDVGVQDDEGNIDFRARGVIRSVGADATVGKLHAPSRGMPGKDVYGRVIPAHDGAVFRINLGENVEATESGSEFKSLIAGMVFFIQNTLSVTEVFTTRGDVNMGTGNLELEKGSVHVRGAILSGFKVKCPRNVLVNDTVESAVIEAGGDVEVKGGIIMDKGGRIIAQGGVSAMFAKGATIEAQGDVNIAHEMSNCIVFAGQNVIATKGRGKIIGSTVRCGGSIIANEVGSDLGVATTIFLGIEQETTDYSERKRELNALLQKVYATLGTGDPRTILVNTPPPKRETVAQLLKMRLGAEKELRDIESNIQQERMAMKQSIQSKLKVTRTIYPGTVIHSYGQVFKVNTPIEHSKIFYDPDEQRIIVLSL
ncbi:FapA family protein [Desulfovibrio mangrovi]|uniref:FapA family protein n=1 Tax=Desulfovibrio mangrovi TaxID=2976983 RepID=UPI0022468740|nr:FapA family protein [Desulfovibrio mangrovi]UZP67854.1 FapA family protein [Desulfovibrio mangrovi]